MRKRPSNMWERERKRERIAGYIVAGVVAFFAVMALSQGSTACDVLGGILLFAAGVCLVETVFT